MCSFGRFITKIFYTNRLGSNNIDNHYHLKQKIRCIFYSYGKPYDFKKIILSFGISFKLAFRAWISVK